MDVREAAKLIEGRARDYRPALPDLQLRLLKRRAYLDAAKSHPPVAEQIELGLFADFEAEFRTPVFSAYAEHVLTACPQMVVEILAGEPRQLHRPYIDG